VGSKSKGGGAAIVNLNVRAVNNSPAQSHIPSPSPTHQPATILPANISTTNITTNTASGATANINQTPTNTVIHAQSSGASVSQQPVIQTTPVVNTSPTTTQKRTCSIQDFNFVWSGCLAGWQTGIYIKKLSSDCVGGEPGSARQTCVYVAGGPSAGGLFGGGPTSTITTIAGNGLRESAIDEVQATQSSLSASYNVRTDSVGNIYIADRGHVRVRKVDKSTGIITTVPTTTTYLHASDIALDSSDNIYVADDLNNKVLKVDKSTGAVTTVAGIGRKPYVGGGFSGDFGPATSAELYSPRAVALDSAGNVYVSDFGNGRVRKINKATGIITTVVGSSEFCLTPTDPCGDGSLATLSKLISVNAIAFDAQDNMYITGSNRIRKIDRFTGIITTVAGTGQPGYSGDSVPATSAKLNFTSGVDLDADGNIYIAESDGRRIRKVEKSTGIITTIAGTGEEGYSGDGGQALNARLQPFGIHVSQAGKIYIADARYGVIRAIG
ncbi:MAG TPA: hypothetical protein VJA47_05675, partial [archaeon]|nr:hypothetical protein [archaeon]